MLKKMLILIIVTVSFASIAGNEIKKFYGPNITQATVINYFEELQKNNQDFFEIEFYHWVTFPTDFSDKEYNISYLTHNINEALEIAKKNIFAVFTGDEIIYQNVFQEFFYEMSREKRLVITISVRRTLCENRPCTCADQM